MKPQTLDIQQVQLPFPSFSPRSLWLGLGSVLLIILLLISLPPATNEWTTNLRERRSKQIDAFEGVRVAVESDIQRMQAAQRGYLITQQADFLETYQDASVQLTADLQQMHALAPLVKDGLVQNVAELEAGIKQWQVDGPAKQLELIQQNDLASAVAEVSNGQSQQRFEGILESLRSMRAEIDLINAELAAYIGGVRAIGTAIATALGILGVVVAGYLVRVFRAMASLTQQLDHERRRAEQAVVAAEDASAQVLHQLDDMSWRNQQLRVLNRIAASAGEPLQVEVRADRLVDELVDALVVESGAVWRLNAAQQQLELISKRGIPNPAAATLIPLSDEGIVAQAIADDAPRIVEDVQDQETIVYPRSPGPPTSTTIRSAVALPLRGRDGIVGAVLLATSAAGHFRNADFDYYVALASHAGLLLENAELYEAIMREQQRLHVIFEQSPEGLIFAEADTGTIVLANQAARTLIADPLPSGAPLTAETFSRLRRPNGSPFGDDMPLLSALRGKEQIGVEVVIEHKDGQRIPTLFNCVPLQNSSGELSGALALFQDLSRFREVERLKSDFVAMVSHELRTPLTAIQGCAQSLLHSFGRADTQRTEEFLQIIESQSIRLHELIDNLLNMSQMEAGALQLRKAPLQPARLARSIARQASERLNDVRVQAELPPSLPTISADAIRIEQVLLNLVDNARKYSPQNGLISINAHVQGDMLVFSVQDQGPGISAVDRERVFERFYQGEPPPSGPHHGTGLGLAICKALVEAHGGTIWVDPRQTRGARICFSLPIVLAHPEQASRQTPLVKALPAGHEVAHVLIVDDEPPVRLMLEGSLRNAGYVVHAVPEGQAALEYLATEQPDLVVLDLILPGQDGFAVLQQIRDWSQVLVMILTASSEPSSVVRGLQLGADDYLTKPFSMDEFLARIETLLRRRHTEATSTPSILQHGPLVIDFSRRRVEVNGSEVDLTPIEFRLLAYLAKHPNQVLTHTQILQHVWGPEFGDENQYLWVHIGRLRQKIEPDPKAPQLIATERGVGYRLAA